MVRFLDAIADPSSVRELCNLLYHHHPKIRFETAWVLTNIARCVVEIVVVLGFFVIGYQPLLSSLLLSWPWSLSLLAKTTEILLCSFLVLSCRFYDPSPNPSLLAPERPSSLSTSMWSPHHITFVSPSVLSSFVLFTFKVATRHRSKS